MYFVNQSLQFLFLKQDGKNLPNNFDYNFIILALIAVSLNYFQNNAIMAVAYILVFYTSWSVSKINQDPQKVKQIPKELLKSMNRQVPLSSLLFIAGSLCDFFHLFFTIFVPNLSKVSVAFSFYIAAAFIYTAYIKKQTVFN